MADIVLQSVTIRMYRQGFGDCFLLTFNYSDASFKRMMIDFGVLMGSDGEDKMKDIANNILATTRVKKAKNAPQKSEIDILVVTHEHWDHFSGFTKNQAQDIIRDLEVKKIWLAWTEDKGNEYAVQLKKRKEKIKENLEKGVVHLAQKFEKLKDDDKTKGFYKKNKDSISHQLSNIVELLKFESTKSIVFADTDGETVDKNEAFIKALANPNKFNFGAKAKSSKENNDETGIIGILSKVWPKIVDEKKYINFHEAGKLIDLPWAGIRIYSLGPPNDWDYIRKNESNQEGELYLSDKIFENPSDVNIKNPNTFMNSFLFAEKDTQKSWSDDNIPFDENWVRYDYQKDNKLGLVRLANQKLRDSEQKRIIENIEESEAYRLYTGISGSEKRDDEEFNAVRRIDVDYLTYVEPLAMKLNTHTNNTSLALAIELIDSGKVLLFPGDAQYGNWLSWTEKKLSWEIREGEKKQKITVEDLLARTIFYKVSHHGSHNGTPQSKGLELMKDGSLIAVIPVDKKAAQEKDWNKIPYEPIMAKLQTKAKKINGKPAILRSDEDFETSTEINGGNKLYFDITISNKK